LAAYTTALNYFTESCPKLYLQDIERADLLKFSAFLRDKKKQAPRSVYNKFENVMTFLKANRIRGLVGKNDWPRYTEEEPKMYEKAELTKLLAACDVEERLWYEFFLMTGMREQEVMYTYWSDVNFAASTVRVSHKPDRGWTPKAYKEREVPIPSKLAKGLKAWKAKADKTCGLVFPTEFFCHTRPPRTKGSSIRPSSGKPIWTGLRPPDNGHRPILQKGADEWAVYLQAAVVADEAFLLERIHKFAYPCAGCTNHFREGCLAHLQVVLWL